MNLFVEQFRGEKIPASELVQMGIRIKNFVENYRKYVAIRVPNGDGNNPIEVLNKLDDISHKLITQQFDQLFDNINIIDFDDRGVPF